MSTYRVDKRDPHGKVTFSYTGEVVERTAQRVCIRALFGFERRLDYVHLKVGDVFTEWFYADRWYNVFMIHDVDSHALKGYYCNLTRPAEIHADHVGADDLELDVFVTAEGKILLLDEKEYAKLALPAEERAKVAEAVQTIRTLVAERHAPFDALP